VKTPDLEEQLAINRLKHGDLDGLETLVNCYQVKAVYAAYLIVRDMKLAEDIVQSAFLRAAQKIYQFDDRRPFAAWFLRSVVHAAIKADKQQKRLVPLDPHEDEESNPLIGWMLDPKPGPDQVIETAETRQMVWKAMESLSGEQRAAIIMRHFLEMNETEMTQKLGRPLTTVRWWLRTARNQLRERLRPFWKTDHQEENERLGKTDG
jgi:RNA polymerase sigma-70 factor (ECF subfamily)